jgi:ubiquinone/menaquinone biosynthesis C-methylase UbiE
MTEQAERYDRIADGYEQWWAPVLAPSAVALLDRLDPVVAAGATDVLDVGIGTGNLTLVALQRWPGVRITAIDASREMLASAERLAEARLLDEERSRLTTKVAFAHELPAADASFDLAMSSFVLQLVPDRGAAIREIARVLRAGGWLAHVTWLVGRMAFAPDRIFDDLLDEFGFDEEAEEERTGDIPSATAARDELKEAGFVEVTAEERLLEHPFTADSYLRFLTEFDEATFFQDEMTRTERRRFVAKLRDALVQLSPDDLVFRAPIVYAMGRRPSDEGAGRCDS